MKKQWLVLFISLGVILYLGTISGCSGGGEQHDEAEHHQGEEHATEEALKHTEHPGEEGHDHHGHHEAHHGGVLNVIGEEAGHIEIRLEGNSMEAWFVGGGNDTHRSIPIKAEEVPLAVTLPGQVEKEIVLKADPMKLAGEDVGNCSRFVGQADWLQDAAEFEAHGEVELKGVVHELVIHYPQGYDPMHGHQGHAEH